MNAANTTAASRRMTPAKPAVSRRVTDDVLTKLKSASK